MPSVLSSSKNIEKRRYNTIGGGCPGADVWLERGLEDRPTYSQGDSTPHTKGGKISTLRAHACAHILTRTSELLSNAMLLAAVAALLCMPWRILKWLMPQVCVCVCGKAACVCACEW